MSDSVILPARLPIGREAVGRIADVVRSPRYTLLRRTTVAMVAIIAAFHYSLSTLVRTLKDQTPLAYLGLVPIMAVLLAAALIRPEDAEPAIHDRQLDYIIGVPLLIAALAFAVFMPVRMSTLFWLYRMDLLALPLFAAGAISLVLGVRTLWRLRIPIAFLILAWPFPYSTLLVNWLNTFTSSTLAGLNVILHVAHVASPAPAQGVGLYSVSHGHTNFPVSVASACSGVNGIVGYMLVAVAFLTVVLGGWLRKALWLLMGLVAVWMSNVVRIFIILLAGHEWGEAVAIKVLHPFMGLVTFNLVVLGMVLLMGRFGLRMRFSGRRSWSTFNAQVVRTAPKGALATVILFAVAAAGFLANSTLRSFDLVVTSLGAPRLVSFTDAPTHPAGWSVVRTDVYTWAKPYFGEDSTWNRYAYSYTGDPTATLKSTGAIISDVINTSDLSTFNTYGIEACYRFHGYKLHSIRTVDLGGGVTANVLAYYNSGTRSDWTTVYWHWPVKTATGKTRYERVTLMLLNTAGVSFSGPSLQSSPLRSLGLGVQNAISGAGSVDSHLAKSEAFLEQFAHAVIEQQAVASGSAKAPASSATQAAR